MSTFYPHSPSLRQPHSNPLIIYRADVIEFIPLSEILYCKASRSCRQIYLINNTLITHTKCLSKLHEEMDDCFIKISKSVIVNKAYIRKINKKEKTIVLLNNQELPFSTTLSFICESMQKACLPPISVPL